MLFQLTKPTPKSRIQSLKREQTKDDVQHASGPAFRMFILARAGRVKKLVRRPVDSEKCVNSILFLLNSLLS